MNNFRRVIAFIIGICVFIFVMSLILYVYKELTGYDLASDNEGSSRYSPPFSGMMNMVVSVSLGIFVGSMVYDKVYRISDFSDELYGVFLFSCGSLVFIIFNLIKEMALAPYISSGLVESISLILDILVVWWVWWSFSKVEKQHKEKKYNSRFN